MGELFLQTEVDLKHDVLDTSIVTAHEVQILWSVLKNTGHSHSPVRSATQYRKRIRARLTIACLQSYASHSLAQVMKLNSYGPLIFHINNYVKNAFLVNCSIQTDR